MADEEGGGPESPTAFVIPSKWWLVVSPSVESSTEEVLKSARSVSLNVDGLTFLAALAFTDSDTAAEYLGALGAGATGLSSAAFSGFEQLELVLVVLTLLQVPLVYFDLVPGKPLDRRRLFPVGDLLSDIRARPGR